MARCATLFLLFAAGLTSVSWMDRDYLPEGNRNMVFAALRTPPSYNLGQIERMDNAGFSMDVIDIPELCMRNIAMLLPQDSDGVALLYLAENCGYLTITREGVLHLIRRIETGRHLLAAAANDEFLLQELLAGISLEVQRSLDYYESHFDYQSIGELVICRGAGAEVLPAALAEHLGLDVSQIQLGDLFHLENEISSEAEGHCFLAIGAALRIEEAAAGARSA